MLHKPRLLLLDEPTVGLDMPSREAIVQHVHDLVEVQQLAVLWATHLIDEIAEEDSVVILHRGRIRAQGGLQNLLSESQTENIEQLFKHHTVGVA